MVITDNTKITNRCKKKRLLNIFFLDLLDANELKYQIKFCLRILFSVDIVFNAFNQPPMWVDHC